MIGGAKPIEMCATLGTDAPDEEVTRVLELASASSPAESYMRESLQNTFSLTANQRALELQELRPSARLAEDPEILLPVNLAYDGWFISYLSDRVEIPAQKDVDRFLPKQQRWPVLTPDKPMRHPGAVWGVEFNAFRQKHMTSLQRVKDKIEAIEEEFYSLFGRRYGGVVEEYMAENADIVIVALGGCAATARVVVDKKRENGLNVGLVRVRVLRPFPREKLVEVLKGKKAIGVIDRNVCYGWNCGTLFMELKAALFDLGMPIKALNFIDGLCGTDITKEHIESAIDLTRKAADGGSYEEVTWLCLG